MTTRKQAAEELIRASDAARELSRAGKLTDADARRVQDAVKAYEKASGK